MGGGNAMPNQAIDRSNRETERRRLRRARALLEIFEEDRGRRAVTVDELKAWMDSQYIEELQIRMNRRLYGI
jgi:hypothetical protein